jgi:hypothetical protein
MLKQQKLMEGFFYEKVTKAGAGASVGWLLQSQFGAAG